MTTDRSLIHRLLDADLPKEEQKELLRRIEADPILQAEYRSLQDALEVLDREGGVEPPREFTRSVLARLPKKKAPAGARIREFLFGSRVLRWNLASATAVALIAIAAVILLQRKPETVLVRLEIAAPSAQRVAVAGDFNKWSAATHVMTRQNGTWAIELPLRPGVYAYMFIVDNEQWITDPGAAAYRDDGFGNRNAVMRVAL